MTVKGKDVIGLKIITINDGKEIGTVRDVIYDPGENTVRALLVDDAGWFSDAKVIAIPDVESVGENAVMIRSQEMIKKAADVGEGVSNIAKDDQYLTKTQIVTENGTELGTVSDILFDPETGLVSEFEVSQGLLKNAQSGKKRVRVNDIITVGKDATIVRGYTEESFDRQSQEQGISGAVHQAREQAPSVAERIRDTATNAAETVREKATEIRKHPKTQQMGDSFRQKTAEAAETIKSKAGEIRKNQDVQNTADAARLQGRKAREGMKRSAQAYRTGTDRPQPDEPESEVVFIAEDTGTGERNIQRQYGSLGGKSGQRSDKRKKKHK